MTASELPPDVLRRHFELVIQPSFSRAHYEVLWLRIAAELPIATKYRRMYFDPFSARFLIPRKIPFKRQPRDDLDTRYSSGHFARRNISTVSSGPGRKLEITLPWVNNEHLQFADLFSP